ncbi:sensor histidine kinase [Aneurinibacillus aneurinilyticus]|uniref:sensor histidine kinase n=1 Tax=Aneurinibacillus aneurinilyticus TaxID=1391 RepID=UPI0023F39715|nr:HAMP domain-containing sensor histidine kinase [Aneurinibacillus aneurinilyticus]
MKNKPLAVQIWLVFSGVMTIILCIVILLIPLLVQPFLVQDTYARISEAQTLISNRQDNGPGSGKPFRTKDNGVVHHLLFVNGEWIAPPSSLTRLPTEFLATAQGQALLQTEEAKQYKAEVGQQTLYYIIRVQQMEGQNFFLLSYALDTYQREFISSLIRQLFGMTALILLASFPFCYWLSKYLSRPLVQIEQHVQRLAERDWNKPLLLDRKDEIGRLAKSVERMRRRLVKQDETQRTLLQNVSHELKTPVMVIRSYTQAIQDGIYPSGDLSQTVEVIEKEAERLERQIQQLLYLTKLDYLATQELTTHSVCVVNIIQDAVQRLRWRRPELEWEINVPDIHVEGDEEQLRTALENILDNQIRYAQQKIWISGKKANEDGAYTFQLRLGNDGPPIPPENIQTIFEPYRKGASGQFGLGLAIVKRIVDLHHGKIGIKNEETGPVFTMQFPLDQKDSPTNVS